MIRPRLYKFPFRALSVLVLFWAVLSIGCSKPTAAEVETKIAGSAKLRGLDQICTKLPKQTGMKFIEKSISGNASSSMVGHKYTSSKSFESTRKFYLSLPEDSGFVVTHADSEVRRMGSEIRLEYGTTEVLIFYRPRYSYYDFVCIHESR